MSIVGEEANVRHTVYWATLDCAGGVDLFVNDVPAVRLGPLGGVRRPLNEYCLRGANRIALRHGEDGRAPAVDPPGTPPAPPPAATVTVEAVEFLDADEIGRATVYTGATNPTAGVPVGAELLTGTFGAPALRGGLVGLAALRPLLPPDRATILATLAEVAGWWRAGEAEKLLAFLKPYVDEFADSYALEDALDYRTDFRLMVEAMHRPDSRVSFDPAAVRLDRCGDGRLAECRGADGGAAIRVESAEIERYDFNLIVGMQGDQVIAYR